MFIVQRLEHIFSPPFKFSLFHILSMNDEYIHLLTAGYISTYLHGPTDWFQIGKGVHQDCILSPCLFNLYAEYIMRNAGLEEAQALLGDISITSDMQMIPPLWQKVKRN